MGLYGDIYESNGTDIHKTWGDEIRRLCGNIRPDVLTAESIESARISGSEETERATRRQNISPATEVELYNLMSKATNLIASAEIMAPFNDKQETRKLNIMEFNRITKIIMETELPTDITVDTSSPIQASSYSTGTLAQDGVGEGLYISTKYGFIQW